MAVFVAANFCFCSFAAATSFFFRSAAFFLASRAFVFLVASCAFAAAAAAAAALSFFLSTAGFVTVILMFLAAFVVATVGAASFFDPNENLIFLSLTGDDRNFRSDSRFLPEPTFLQLDFCSRIEILLFLLLSSSGSFFQKRKCSKLCCRSRYHDSSLWSNGSKSLHNHRNTNDDEKYCSCDLKRGNHPM